MFRIPPTERFICVDACQRIRTSRCRPDPHQVQRTRRHLRWGTITSLSLWMNGWLNFITYVPPVKPQGQAQWCILRRSMVFNPLGDDSPVKMWAIFPLLVEWELGWGHHVIFAASRRVPYMEHMKYEIILYRTESLFLTIINEKIRIYFIKC